MHYKSMTCYVMKDGKMYHPIGDKGTLMNKEVNGDPFRLQPNLANTGSIDNSIWHRFCNWRIENAAPGPKET